MKIKDILTKLLENGSRKYEDLLIDLSRSSALGFGVEAEAVVSSFLRSGFLVSHDDGHKTWIKLGSPFVRLHRGFQSREFLAYKPTNSDGFDDARNAIVANEDSLVDIQWPNGTITQEQIKVRVSERTVVGKHGIMSVVESDIPGFEMGHNGLSVWIPLDTHGLRVRSDAFTTG